jgi:hypothetical protein
LPVDVSPFLFVVLLTVSRVGERGKEDTVARRRKTRIGVLLGCVSFSVASLTQSTLRVLQDDATIQAAVDAAEGGDTVVGAAGRHHENPAIRDRQDLVLQRAGSGSMMITGNASIGVEPYDHARAGPSENVIRSTQPNREGD